MFCTGDGPTDRLMRSKSQIRDCREGSVMYSGPFHLRAQAEVANALRADTPRSIRRSALRSSD
jgi:hypothetical protein